MTGRRPPATCSCPAGRCPTAGWSTPHAGVGITAAEVATIIAHGIAEANQVRAAIRLPLGDRTRMVFAVTDSTGEVLGLFRMPDATVFSIDVAVAKARNVAYYADPAQLQAVDQVAGVPAGTAFTNRTFRYLAHAALPDGIDGTPPAPFSILNDPGIDPRTGLQRRPAAAGVGVHTACSASTPSTPARTSATPTDPAQPERHRLLPRQLRRLQEARRQDGSSAASASRGDGVDQDDVVTHFGIRGYGAPEAIRADQVFVRGVRLPYFKFPRNPER